MSTMNSFESVLKNINDTIREHLGRGLEHFPVDGDRSRECWQYDGWEDGNGIVIQMYRFINKRGQDSIVLDVEHDIEGGLSITGPIIGWWEHNKDTLAEMFK